MEHVFSVENIKCHGCARTIQNNLSKKEGVSEVTVDVAQGMVTVVGDNFHDGDISSALLSMGYPEKGSVSGLNSIKAKGKSFVSCAIGRIDKSEAQG